jgi:hypothetical protein
MRVDADDYLSLKACLILISFMENNNYPFVYGDITKIDNKKNHEVIKRDKVNNLLEHGAGVLFRTKILKKLGGYNTKIKNCEDYDLIARIINVYGTGLYLPINYYRYYKTPSSHLSNKKKRNRILSEMKKKYEKFISKD